MTELVSRAHMQGPVVELADKSERKSASETVEGQEIVWQSYRDLDAHFIALYRNGGLPFLAEPQVNKEKKTAIVNGKEVKRQPYVDDFADMMRVENKDNHQRLERYVNPLGPAGGLDWFRATALAVMIENGRVGLKKSMSGKRAVYISRSRTGNPFFRVWSGRATLLIFLAQIGLLFGYLWYVRPDDVYSVAPIGVAITVFYLYNLIHWRFHKRYAFVLGGTLIEGFTSGSTDPWWAMGRLAVHAVSVAVSTAAFFSGAILAAKYFGWL